MLIFCLKGSDPGKPENEDAASCFLASPKGTTIMVAADGVTRGPHNNEPYPSPSPAALAAQAAVRAMAKFLADHHESNELAIAGAFIAGNQAVGHLNAELGLFQSCDYLAKDLAGTVAACAVAEGDLAYYGFIGDCGVAKLTSRGAVNWQTADEVTPVRKHFPDAKKVGLEERYRVVRRDFRNKPGAPHPTYGVMTGEREALTYVRSGQTSLDKGERLLVYTDGVTPYLNDGRFCQMLLDRPPIELEEYVADNPLNNDDKTLLMYLPR